MLNKRISARVKFNDASVKKDTIEWVWIWSLLFFSFINGLTLTLSIISLLLFFRQQEIGAIKILNIITLRTIINTGVAVDIGIVQNLKWVIIFICSFYLIASFRKIDNILRVKLIKILFPISLFALYSGLASLITSTLPTVAVFKLVSYVIVFMGIIIGVFKTSPKINWLEWINKIFMGLFILSLPLLFSPIGFLRNGHSFQGITNQPNMFGIILVLFFGIRLTKLQLRSYRSPYFAYAILVAVLYMGILTKSRTSIIIMIVLLVLYLTLIEINLFKKIMACNFIGLSLIVYLFLDKQILQDIKLFFYKDQDNILSSRINQIDGLVSNFMRNPWFGSGFAVPVTPFRTFAFNSKYVVEPGNLILSVLSYGGIMGLIFFLIYMFSIFREILKNFSQTVFLFLSPILVSMGEMVFFSSNNIGIWCYTFIAIAMIIANDLPNKVGGK